MPRPRARGWGLGTRLTKEEGSEWSREIAASGLVPSRKWFTLFTDSEVRHVRCDYVIHYSSAYVTMLEGNLACPKHRNTR